MAMGGAESRRGGEPILRGTTVEVFRTAALVAGGMPVSEVLVDYPSLTPDQIEAALAYAEKHPRQARPYPARTAKAVLRSGRGGLRRALAATAP